MSSKTIVYKSVGILFAIVTSLTANAVAKPSLVENKVHPVSAIGFIAGVSGDVRLDGVPVKSGHAIRVGSKIETGADGKLQILIGDGMVAAVGFDSKIKIEKFEKKSIHKIISESAQVELQKGSLRYLISKSEDVLRMATVRSGDAFGIIKSGEGHFACGAACAKKYEEAEIATREAKTKPQSSKVKR